MNAPRLLAVALFAAVLAATPLSTSAATTSDFKAGVGRSDITPTGPVWLAGYAGRNKPSDGVEQRLSTKALAFQDAAGNTTLVVTADTIGPPRKFTEELATRIERELKIPRARFLFASSHSHAAPVMRDGLREMYGLSDEHYAAVVAYSVMFQQRAFEAAQAAVKDLQPARLTFGRGNAGFAANRRAFTAKGVNFGVNRTGMVDHDVPVLRVEGTNGLPRAVLYGYACHCTTLGPDFYKVCGDWATYSQEHVETAYPGATAMVMIGCGADANPEPRGKLWQARQHGLALAGAVARVLNEPMRPVTGNIAAAFERVELPLSETPTREDFAKKAADRNQSVARFGKKFVDMLDRGEKPITSYPCPVQVLRFGKDLTVVALGGEVVVDYSHRLKRELPDERLWVAAYCNDVFAYVPSMRILTEGGYEAEFNLIYYGIPSKFAPAVEDTLVKKVVEMVKQASK